MAQGQGLVDWSARTTTLGYSEERLTYLLTSVSNIWRHSSRILMHKLNPFIGSSCKCYVTQCFTDRSRHINNIISTHIETVLCFTHFIQCTLSFSGSARPVSLVSQPSVAYGTSVMLTVLCQKALSAICWPFSLFLRIMTYRKSSNKRPRRLLEQSANTTGV